MEKGIEVYFFLQLVLDALLLFCVFVLFVKVRRFPSEKEVSQRLSRLEELAKELGRYVEEEKGLIERLKKAVEAGARAWEGESKKGLRKKVVELYEQGIGVSEIAKRLSLSEGEVELLVSLEKFRKALR